MAFSLRNAFQVAATSAELAHFRQAAWRLYQPAVPVPVQAFGQAWQLRPGLTFTPFANAVRCNAHCAFCSEELQRDADHRLTAKRLIDDYPAYFKRLADVLRPFRGFPLGLSLSGLEATAEPRWLRDLLVCLRGLEQEGVVFDEKVLYTNGSGLATSPDLGLALQDFGLTRLELSRCHPDEAVNQGIMRFNRNQPIRHNAVYEATVRWLHAHLAIKNSCILTRAGVATLPDVEQYLAWAAGLGVRQVVFRELSRLEGSYLPNVFTEWIEAQRVPIEPLLAAVVPSLENPRAGWQYAGSTFGYYYYNEHYRYQGLDVIFETSSYPALQAATATDVVQKLILHSDGTLSGDWDPQSRVLSCMAAPQIVETLSDKA
ncbi:radical SAM protein [Hymenobacter yonginensis]|uniref:Radical SAM protein n=1 Tax=Hymenobacter yonginensis TaxID=748197 RepID=A0ABY7PNC7_9BACT|nr:radical SAM protein [Hymenobacter yonginensis]WBO84619.1 radical SAM protein [Hymenobacter yonginensis]